MSLTTKRRREVRYQLKEPIVIRILLRSLRRGAAPGVDAILTDVSKGGLGILVQEHVALETRCYVEVPAGGRIRRFKGEVCYGQRGEEGIKLGIMLAPNNPMSVLEFLEKHEVEFTPRRDQ